MSVSEKLSNNYQTHLLISSSKLRDQNWPELNPPPSQLGVGAFFTAQAVPHSLLLDSSRLRSVGLPRSFTPRPRVRRAVSSSLHLCILPSSSPPPAMPYTHPQRRRRRLVTVAISEKPKLALLAVHRWQRHFAFLLIRKQNNMIKLGPIRRRVDKHVPQIERSNILLHLLHEMIKTSH